MNWNLQMQYERLVMNSIKGFPINWLKIKNRSFKSKLFTLELERYKEIFFKNS